MMEFWFIDRDKKKLRLPVPPPEFTVETGQEVNIVKISEYGEHSQKGDPNLDRITFSSFFPSQKYPFCQYQNFPTPYHCVNTFLAWKNSSEPVQVLITESGINKFFYIESFSYGEMAGSRDVNFEITLVECRSVTVTKTRPKTHKVVKGDTLTSIARRYYNNAAKWADIAKKNNIKDPKQLTVGQVLILP